jgi:hypothetical protein
MKVQINNTDYFVRWQHNLNNNPIGTICRVECDNQVFEDYSILSPKDKFNRNKGRKISLTRVIRGFKKEERKLFWESYYKMRNNKW